MINDFIKFVRELYKDSYAADEFIPLHAPVFTGKEKELVVDAIDSTFVSSVSQYVTQFEQMLCDFTGAKYAVSMVNGTSALHLALHAVGVDKDCEVITQSLTFVATCNAISYTGAQSILLDVDSDTLGLSPQSVEKFLQENAQLIDGVAINKNTGKRIAACVPMHTFGHPMQIQELVEICERWNILVVEDAAEALGSYVLNDNELGRQDKQHCGTFGKCGMLSFNGNKIITTGGGGAVITDDKALADRLRHLSTTAKTPHPWHYEHDEIGFNYRMPGLNAALGCAQMLQLPEFLRNKREIAHAYQRWANSIGIEFVTEPKGTESNYWLNAFLLESEQQRDEFLAKTNSLNVMTRPAWQPMHKLNMYDYVTSCTKNTDYLAAKLINIPSGASVNQ